MITLDIFLIFLICIWSLDVSVCKDTQPPAKPAGRPTIIANPAIDLKQQATYFNSLISQHNLDQMAIDLAKLTCQQRMQVKMEYMNAYARSIDQDIAGKTEKTFMRLIYALIQPMPELMANTIDWSLSQSHDYLYMSLLCTTPADLLTQIANSYAAGHSKALVDVIKEKLNDPDGQDFLCDILGAVTGSDSKVKPRPNNTIAKDLIQTQVNYIPQAKDHCSQQDNPDLYNFMAGASFAQIAAVVEAFQQKTSLSAASQIRQFCSGDLSEAYSRIVIFASDPASYWTTEVYNSMGYGETIDRGLTVAILYRSEIDLATIRDSFKTTYHNDLTDFIKDHCKGTYETVMENIVGGVQ